MQIMIVDDNPRIRQLLILILKRHIKGPLSFTECENGAGAPILYSRDFPDWVLMDIEMPGVDGLAATQNIIYLHPQAKVIIVSQYDDSMYRDAAKKMGAFGYVLKENLQQIPNVINEYNENTIEAN